MVLDKKYKLTVCCDGFVSITEDMKKRRLGAALPFHSVDDLLLGVQLIRQLCVLRQCDHGKKTGITIEPHAFPNWPFNSEGEIEDVQKLALIFQKAEKDLIVPPWN